MQDPSQSNQGNKQEVYQSQIVNKDTQSYEKNGQVYYTNNSAGQIYNQEVYSPVNNSANTYQAHNPSYPTNSTSIETYGTNGTYIAPPQMSMEVQMSSVPTQYSQPQNDLIYTASQVR